MLLCASMRAVIRNAVVTRFDAGSDARDRTLSDIRSSAFFDGQRASQNAIEYEIGLTSVGSTRCVIESFGAVRYLTTRTSTQRTSWFRSSNDARAVRMKIVPCMPRLDIAPATAALSHDEQARALVSECDRIFIGLRGDVRFARRAVAERGSCG